MVSQKIHIVIYTLLAFIDNNTPCTTKMYTCCNVYLLYTCLASLADLLKFEAVFLGRQPRPQGAFPCMAMEKRPVDETVE